MVATGACRQGHPDGAPAPRAAGPPVTRQPTAEDRQARESRNQLNKETLHNFREYREYFDSLDVDAVVKWGPRDVADQFLQPMNLGALAQIFIEHKISGWSAHPPAVLHALSSLSGSTAGRTLLGLTKDDLRAMKILAIGDRVLIANAVKYIAKIQVSRQADLIHFLMS